MASFNKVILLGNLTRDPELRATQSGQQIAKFGMAINRKFTSGGEQREETCFVDLTAWGRQAEVIHQYSAKGRALLVEGRLQFSTWESKEGKKRSKLEVIVENFQFVGGREGGGEGGGSDKQPAAARDEAQSREEDNIPF
jgi:single-strand DNA-binding protein